MISLQKRIAPEWIAAFPAALGILFWIGYFWAFLEGSKDFMAGIPHLMGSATCLAVIIGPIVVCIGLLLLIGESVEKKRFVVEGFLLGVSPAGYLLILQYLLSRA